MILRVAITHPDRVLFPTDGITKAELIEYYAEVTPVMVPHRTCEIRRDRRSDRLYPDVMRNAYGQTAVAPYAVRARPGAPVATPLNWDEPGVRGMRADRFTLRDVPKRISKQPDPWASMRRHARSLSRPRQRLTALQRR